METGRCFGCQNRWGKGEWELFNIKEDPADLTDLSIEKPQQLRELVELWEQYKEENGVLDTLFN